MDVIDLAEAFARIDKPWTPRIVGEVNGFHAKITLSHENAVTRCLRTRSG